MLETWQLREWYLLVRKDAERSERTDPWQVGQLRDLFIEVQLAVSLDKGDGNVRSFELRKLSRDCAELASRMRSKVKT